jgi:hypothetical protein
MVAGAIRLCLGEEPDLVPKHEPRGAAIRYFDPSPGVVRRVEGLEEARRLSGVKIVECYVREGDRIGPIDSSLARAGHVIAEGSTAGEAIRNAERGRDAVRIVIAG